MRRLTVRGIRGRASQVRAAAYSARYRAKDWRQRQGPRSALDFENWVERRRLRDQGFPDAWREIPNFRIADPCRLAVLVHVFYPDLLDELLSQLTTIPVDFDLLVTNATGYALQLDSAAAGNVRHSLVLDVDNHGRDIWPMAQVVNAGLLDPYELVLKVHTKRSAWRESHDVLAGSGGEWRESLLSGLLGTRQNVEQIVGAFAEQPDLGIVTADGSLAGPEHWGADLGLTRELLRRLELTVDDPDRLQFAAGSFYWTRAFVLQGLRAFQFSAADFDAEGGHIDGTTAHAVERAIGLLSREAGLSLATRGALPPADADAWTRYRVDAPRRSRVRLVPFYLPQFHPTPENDRWWGTGFTEWTNVASAQPVYQGHNQPNLPGELGFYDLRLDEVRSEQTLLARNHGIEAFMYYYYWFAGRRLLDVPLGRLIASDLEKSFCIMWANENWTRRWDGRTEDVLMGQDYTRVPATEFIDDVLPMLRDRRYLRVEGMPLLAVYRVGQIPNHAAVIAHWREQARKGGVGELLILAVDVADEFDGLSGGYAEAGLDGILGFPPHNLQWDWLPHAPLRVDSRFQGNLLSYRAIVEDARRRLLHQPDTAYPGVLVNFDNTPRRQWAPDLWYGANPYTFRRWLAAACGAVAHREPEQRLVFVNAWNEWAEGAVLEPTRRFGRSYLHAVRDVMYG